MSDNVLRVMCINNGKGTLSLVIGKTYTVLEEDNVGYLVENEDTVSKYYSKERFEIIEEDKQVKEYTLTEVINIIQDGEEYKNSDEIWIVKSIKKEDGYIKFYFDGEEIGYIGFNPQQRFIKVQPKIDFIEAWKSYLEGKIIKSLVTEDKYMKGETHMLILTKDGREKGFVNCTCIFPKEIEGEWVIEE